MILTDYYKFEEIVVRKSHRFDCTASTGGYEPLETKKSIGRDKVARLYCYYNGVPDNYSAHAKRKADRAFFDGKSNWSSVFTPEIESPLLGYGDMYGTQDAMLFLFAEDYKSVEMLVGRGLKNHQLGLFYRFLDGELDDEIEALKKQAKPTNAPQN